MTSQKDDTASVCPHCGYERPRAAELWISGFGQTGPSVCAQCRKPLPDARRPGGSESRRTGGGWFLAKFLVLAALLAGLVICLNQAFGLLAFRRDSGQIAYALVIVVIVASALASGRLRKNFRHLLIWSGIFLVLMVGYSYRYELSGVKDKVMAELVPSSGFENSPNSISFPVSADGHFYIRAEVNQIPITFLADTGASRIVLSPGDAQRLGMDPGTLKFNEVYETANGLVHGSYFRIAELRIGKLQLNQIGASVNEVVMRNSLLGMNFFQRLKSYEVKDDVLTLHW